MVSDFNSVGVFSTSKRSDKFCAEIPSTTAAIFLIGRNPRQTANHPKNIKQSAPIKQI